MWDWVRKPDRRRDIVRGEPPAKSQFIPPRVVGTLAVALVALIAAAALLPPTSSPAVSSEQGATVTTVAARVNEPAGSVIEQTATTLDDGVPSSQGAHDTVRAGGHCDHGL